MNNVTVTHYNKLDAHLEIEWKELWAKAEYQHFFNSVQWFKTCLNAFNIKEFTVVTLYEGSHLVGLVPLTKEKKYGISIFTNPGGKFIDRSAILLRSNDSNLTHILIKELKEFGTYILPEISEELYSSIKNEKGLLIRQKNINYYLPFSDGPLSQLDREQRRKIKKILRENDGSFRFEMLRGSKTGLEIAKKIDQISSKYKKGYSTFADNKESSFFSKFIENNPDDVGINILYFNDFPIAYEIGVRCNNVYYGLNKSFVVAYKKLFPGKILAYLLFQGLYQEGVTMFDFNRGEDQLKRSFTRLSKKQYDVYFLNPYPKMIWIRLLEELRRQLLDWELFYKTYKKVTSLSFN